MQNREHEKFIILPNVRPRKVIHIFPEKEKEIRKSRNYLWANVDNPSKSNAVTSRFTGFPTVLGIRHFDQAIKTACLHFHPESLIIEGNKPDRGNAHAI